jgi:hypothetical protein
MKASAKVVAVLPVRYSLPMKSSAKAASTLLTAKRVSVLVLSNKDRVIGRISPNVLLRLSDTC